MRIRGHSPKLGALARIVRLPVGNLASILQQAGFSNPGRTSMRELAAILTGDSIVRRGADVRALRMRRHGSRYWVAGYSRLIAEWHPTKNGDTFPDEVSFGSHEPIWWKCPKGPDHEWRVAPRHRTTRGRGCPFCRNRSVSVTNSLASLAPVAAREWHPTRNGGLTPDRVVAQSHRYAWWQCATCEEHVWRARVANRWWLDAGCPFCAGQRVTSANALATRVPHLMREWDQKKNEGLEPWLVAWRSHRRVWWRCSRDRSHQWQARIDDRAGPRESGCPVCTGKAPIPQDALEGRRKSVATTFPTVLKEWDYKRNTKITPRDVTFGSHVKVWWRCSQNPDHSWRACVGDRTRGTGCPECAGKRKSEAGDIRVTGR